MRVFSAPPTVARATHEPRSAGLYTFAAPNLAAAVMRATGMRADDFALLRGPEAVAAIVATLHDLGEMDEDLDVVELAREVKTRFSPVQQFASITLLERLDEGSERRVLAAQQRDGLWLVFDYADSY